MSVFVCVRACVFARARVCVFVGVCVCMCACLRACVRVCVYSDAGRALLVRDGAALGTN